MLSVRPVRAVLLGAALVLPLGVIGPLPSSEAGTYTKARVIRVVDGDTIKVDYDNDGRWDDAIRLIGIDTPEHDKCGYMRATRALKSLVRHKVVELTSMTGRVGRQTRPERRVIVPVGTTKVDATTWMLERGMGVWMPRKNEFRNNLEDHLAAQAAADGGIGWFDEDACGAGPAPAGALSMTVQYLADSAMKYTPLERHNQEFVRIRNNSTVPVDIDGWNLRVGNDRRLTVPPGGPIPPGGTLTIHVSSGANTLTDRYLGYPNTLLVDAKLDGGGHVGGGAYLVDPTGDIVASMTWPCPGTCTSFATGSLALSQVLVDPSGEEYYNLNSEVVAITNRGTEPMRIGDMVLEIWPWAIEFPPDDVVYPGETFRVLGGDGQDDRLTLHVGANVPLLPNDHGRVVLRTYNAVVVDCYAWGTSSCPPQG